MKSEISYFNSGVARNLFKRFWPLWAVYLAGLLLILPASLPNQLRVMIPGIRPMLDHAVLCNGVTVVHLSTVVGIAAAMAMFHYLYQSRSCGMMNSLPLRRETLFFTAYLTGLVPLLAADGLTMLLTALLYVPSGHLSFSALLQWLLLAVLGNLTYYNFAVFCAMLTGSLLILPIAYAVLNLTAFVAEACVHEVLEDIIYGLPRNGSELFDWASPPWWLYRHLRVTQVFETIGDTEVAVPDLYRVSGLGALAIYCGASLLFVGFALWLYRRRQMERATDVVAIPVLKPVFKYCMSFGTAVVFAAVVNSLLFRYEVYGLAQAAIVLLLLLVGALIGYFAAEMLIQKTLRVFHGKWTGLAIVWAVLAVLTVCVELDAFGYEKRVPQASEVQSVSLGSYNGADFKEPENIAAALRLHQRLIDEKDSVEGAEQTRLLRLVCTMKDGHLFSRDYLLPLEGGFLAEYEALCNLPEAVLNREVPDIPVEKDTIYYATIHRIELRGDGREDLVSAAELSPAQAAALYQEGLYPDLREAMIGRLSYDRYGEPYFRRTGDLQVRIQLVDQEGRVRQGVYLNVEMDSEHTIAWLEENLGLTVQSLYDLGFREDPMAVG